MAVPETVHAVLAARIDQLPPEEKTLLQTAAVIGLEVPVPLVQALAEFPEDELQQGLVHLQAAELFYETRLFPVYFPGVAEPLGAVHVLAGRVTDAVPLLTQALEQTMGTDMVGFQVFCSLSLGEAQMLAGRLEEAHSLAERALSFSQAHREHGQQAYTLRLLGDIAAGREPPEAKLAETHYRQALALAEALGMRPLQAHCHHSFGTLYAQLGQREQALVELATAIDFYRAMEMTFWLPQAEGALAQAVGRWLWGAIRPHGVTQGPNI
jgi:predicted ATPase